MMKIFRDIVVITTLMIVIHLATEIAYTSILGRSAKMMQTLRMFICAARPRIDVQAISVAMWMTIISVIITIMSRKIFIIVIIKNKSVAFILPTPVSHCTIMPCFSSSIQTPLPPYPTPTGSHRSLPIRR